MKTVKSVGGVLLGLAFAVFTATPVLAQTNPDLVADLQRIIDKHRAYVKRTNPTGLWKTPPCRVYDAIFWYTDGTAKNPGHNFIALCSNIDGEIVVTIQPTQPDDGVSQYYSSCYKHYFWTRRNCDIRLNEYFREKKLSN